jgi:hypothetical protein
VDNNELFLSESNDDVVEITRQQLCCEKQSKSPQCNAANFRNRAGDGYKERGEKNKGDRSRKSSKLFKWRFPIPTRIIYDER